MSPVHTNPLSAWEQLCEQGGIELKGRDEGLDQKIQTLLDPTAKSFSDALSSTTMEKFVEAFFKSLFPYVEMFRGILDFFENSDATKGSEQWILKVGEIDLDLDHFRQWLLGWEKLGKGAIFAPSIDSKAQWKIFEILQSKIYRGMWNQSKDLSKFEDDVQRWISEIESGLYRPLPKSLTPNQIPKQLSKVASILYVKLQILLNLGLTRERLMEMVRQNRNVDSEQDVFAFWSIAQTETDYWIREMAYLLSSAALLPERDLDRLGSDLDIITNQFPIRPFEVDVSISDLESILSLPIWQQRHELYAVWIATEMIRALRGHKVEIHHDKGNIQFGFKETLVATVHSSPGPFKLISERRVGLENPQGEGRIGGVQPDHQLWTSNWKGETCMMAVEVKHYKNSAKRKFVDIFEDYARALPKAEVYLVSHGPEGKAVNELSGGIRGRCYTIGKLTTLNTDAREQFQTAVRDCVGEPIEISPSTPPTDRKLIEVILFDVSGSMVSLLSSTAMTNYLRYLISTRKPTKFVAADTRILGSFDATEEGYQGLLSIAGGMTNLGTPIAELLKIHDSVLVITDDEGMATVEKFELLGDLQNNLPKGVKVCICKK